MAAELVRNRVTDDATIDVRTTDGIVHLSGAAASDRQKRLATEIALRFPGVKAVENRLRVRAE